MRTLIPDIKASRLSPMMPVAAQGLSEVAEKAVREALASAEVEAAEVEAMPMVGGKG